MVQGVSSIKITPDIEPVDIEICDIYQQVYVLGNVYFPTAKDQLDADDKSELQKIVDWYEPLADSGEPLELYFLGYADYRGDEQFNEDLSKRRATSVREFFDQHPKFKGKPNFKYTIDAKGESEAKQLGSANVNRGPKANVINLLKEDRTVRVCASMVVFEQTWKVTVYGTETWDQQLTKTEYKRKWLVFKDVEWKYIYDGIVLNHRYTLQFTVRRAPTSEKWEYKEGMILTAEPSITNDIKPENDYIRGSTLGADIKEVVFSEPDWFKKLIGHKLAGEMVSETDIKRLYAPARPNIPPSSVGKTADLQFRLLETIGDTAYEPNQGQGPMGYDTVPHVRLSWPTSDMKPTIKVVFKDGCDMQRGGSDMSLWCEHLNGQWVPLKSGSRQFEHVSLQLIHSPGVAKHPHLVTFYHQTTKRLDPPEN